MTLAIRYKGQLIDVHKTLMAIERRKLEASLYDFTVAAWPVVDSAEFAHGGYALQAICEHLEACSYGYIPNLLINVPPRFSKSTLCGVMFPAWVWAQNDNTSLAGPGAQFLHASYAMTLALQDSVKCRTLIESDWYQERWGERFKLVADQNTKTRFQNDRNGIRNTTSVGGSTTGLGGSYLIGDDLNNSAEAYSEAIIQSTIDWWDRAWYNRLNNSRPGYGCRIVVAQRLSERDISGHVLERQIGEWTHLCLPMRYDPSRSFHTVLVPAWANDGEELAWQDPRTKAGELLWPERFNEEQVVLLEQTLGPAAASGQLQQLPQVSGGGVIKSEWWQFWAAEEYPPMDYVIACLDTAYTVKQENDYSALTVWGVFYGNRETTTTRSVDRYGKEIVDDTPADFRDNLEAIPKVMLMSAWQSRLELHDLVTRVAETCRDLQVDKLLIENKAAGISVAQEMRRLYQGEGFAVQLYDPKSQDKLARLYSVQHLFAEGMIFAPDRAWADLVINQVSAFPKGRHDDLVDTVSMGLRHLRDLGLLTRSAERSRDVEAAKQYQGAPPPPLYPV
jgi:predicted phage terminase large subunit-like protein